MATRVLDVPHLSLEWNGYAQLRHACQSQRWKLLFVSRVNLSSYAKQRMGYHTIKEGDQALVFNSGGQGTLVIGPRRVRRWNVCVHTLPWLDTITRQQVYIFRGDIEYLRRYVADQNQYLQVKYRDGRKENEPGCVDTCSYCNDLASHPLHGLTWTRPDHSSIDTIPCSVRYSIYDSSLWLRSQCVADIQSLMTSHSIST